MTITSKDNEKLKLVRRLGERKHREREGLFVTEGEDLLEAGRTAGLEPDLLLSEAGSGIGGKEVERGVLDSASSLGSGTRVLAAWRLPKPTERPGMDGGTGTEGRSVAEGRVCVYLHGVGDPANVGAVIRSTAALVEGAVALGPGCADPYGPKALRASMGAIFAVPVMRCGVDLTPAPRVALVAHGGGSVPPEPPVATVCLGAERDGLPAAVVAACERSWSIPLRTGAVESLNVAAAAAIALERIASAIAKAKGEGD